MDEKMTFCDGFQAPNSSILFTSLWTVFIHITLLIEGEKKTKFNRVKEIATSHYTMSK